MQQQQDYETKNDSTTSSTLITKESIQIPDGGATSQNADSGSSSLYKKGDSGGKHPSSKNNGGDNPRNTKDSQILQGITAHRKLSEKSNANTIYSKDSKNIIGQPLKQLFQIDMDNNGTESQYTLKKDLKDRASQYTEKVNT